MASTTTNHKEEPQLTLRCKVAILGSSTVGKTALTQMFSSNNTKFPKNYAMTVGTEFCVKSVKIPETNATVELYIFDMAGNQLYGDMIPPFLSGVSSHVFVFDVTDGSSLRSLPQWLALASSANPDRPISSANPLQLLTSSPSTSTSKMTSASSSEAGRKDTMMVSSEVEVVNSIDARSVVVGNKGDLVDRFAVKSEEGAEMAKKMGMAYFEVSALKGEEGHVDAPFNHIANAFYRSYLEKREQYENAM